MSAIRFAILAAVIAFVAMQIPKFAPQMVDQLTADAPPPPEAVAVATPRLPAPQLPDEPRPRKIAGAGNRGVTLRADASRHYSAEVRINGIRVDVMVDTGATTVALTEETARRLALYPSADDYTGRVSTANGVVAVAPVMLTEIRLGNISVREVEAVIVPGKALGTNLLGMSFLGRLSRFTVRDNEMVLDE